MFCGLFSGTINAEATDIKNGDSSTLFSTVVNPRIPSKVTFAGQTVDLDRVDLFERLDRELTSMAYTHGNTLLTIKRANRYFPKLIPILKKNGVPEDLIYLACIESTLNPRAYSPAKRCGSVAVYSVYGKRIWT